MKDWRHPAHSFRIPKQLVDDALPPTAALLALFLFARAEQQRHDTGRKDDMLQIGYEDMMSGINASRGAIARALKLLIEEGWLFQHPNKGRYFRRYLLQVPGRRLGIHPQQSKNGTAVCTKRLTAGNGSTLKAKS